MLPWFAPRLMTVCDHLPATLAVRKHIYRLRRLVSNLFSVSITICSTKLRTRACDKQQSQSTFTPNHPHISAISPPTHNLVDTFIHLHNAWPQQLPALPRPTTKPSSSTHSGVEVRAVPRCTLTVNNTPHGHSRRRQTHSTTPWRLQDSFACRRSGCIITTYHQSAAHSCITSNGHRHGGSGSDSTNAGRLPASGRLIGPAHSGYAGHKVRSPLSTANTCANLLLHHISAFLHEQDR